ncbi:carboxylesterase/lipase family protein [Streptomyces huiliensis]|uniref:carboxylesterase/lipase family protein n=1 Tax=Streptomyces huiliensis TaxID=2876027 RepID=UPI001CC17C59|nr:carboxylesterase family protein [Streptomyces huiliensis]MBZ4324145.1 carboxylesterase family protein [Streptomyces huiliensis]
MTGDRRPEARTAHGVVRGVRQGAVSAFLGVPYAAPPVGPLRFAPPGPVVPWRGVRDAAAPGPVAPQPPSRLEQVMGDGPFAHVTQDEDCLTVDVWTPAADDAARPVLVFLHGGGFSSGGGGLSWYAGTGLAARGDIVVVTVTYRLGALGFARLGDVLPGAGSGNQGLLDQLQALRWVRDNIAAFGGDPERVTVAGQSAGAVSIVSLLSGTEGRGLFRGAILQSYPGGMLPQTPEAAAAQGALLLDCLGLPAARAADARTLPAAAVLAAQGEAVRRAPHDFLDVTPAFQLVADGRVVAPDPVAAVGAAGAHGVRMLIGTTRDEGAAFFTPGSPLLAGVGPADFARASERWYGDPDRFPEWAHLAPAERAVRMTTEHFFRAPSERLAALLADAGNPAWLYRFDYAPDGSPFGACHCLELPFVFGDLDAWSDAPMLRGADPKDLDTLTDRVQRAWIAFVRDGDPRHPEAPDWDPYGRERREVTVIG